MLDLANRGALAHFNAYSSWWAKPLETDRARIARRLAREGWVNEGGGSHDLYRHPDRRGIIILPRHRILSNGVVRSIAKAAGWA